MWIRSQNKEILINANNFRIAIESNSYYIIYDFYDGEYYHLGEYSTKEKALKVLDFIQRKLILHFTETYEIVRPVLNSEQWEPYWKKNEYVFQMPADEEV